MTTARPQPTPSGSLAGPSGEFRGLTGLRILAAAWVVVFHFHFTPLPGVAQVVDLDVLRPLIATGALGVDLFFVLSGFVITYTYLDKLGPRLRAGATARFVWARASRLWPLYALVFHLFGLWLVARIVFGSDGEIAYQAVQPVVSVTEWLEQVFMVQMWTSEFLDGASWVGSTWSISAEWLVYLLFPVTVLGLFRMRNLPAVVLGSAALALMIPLAATYLVLGHPYYPWSWLVRVLCGFGAGALTYLTVRRMRSTDRTRRGASALAAALPVVIAGGLVLGDLAGRGRGGMVIMLFPLLVGALALADRGPVLVLSTRWAVHGGRISYALYLVHIPMLELYWLSLRRFAWLGPDTVLAYVVGAAVMLATVPVAALAFRLVEEPARRRMRRMVTAATTTTTEAAPAVPTPVSRVSARRAALNADAADQPDESTSAASGTSPRQHVGQHGSPDTTMADALIEAQRRRPGRRSDSWEDHQRAEFVRSGYLYPGN